MVTLISCGGKSITGRLIGPDGTPMEGARVAVAEIDKYHADSAFGVIGGEPFSSMMGNALNYNRKADSFGTAFTTIQADENGEFTFLDTESGDYIIVITYDLDYEFFSDNSIGLKEVDGFAAALPTHDYPIQRIVMAKEIQLKNGGLKIDVNFTK